MIDENGTEVVRYEYDAWGNPISTTGTLAGTIGKRNPFRYRGYYWDEETGMYYLESRYYDPEIRRFISADSVVITSLAGTNLYMYCGNNPVNMTDPSGYFALEIGLLLFEGALLFGTLIGGFTSKTDIPSINIRTGKNKLRFLVPEMAYDDFQEFVSSLSVKYEKINEEKRNFYNRHHIVARFASDAQESRDILTAVGIDVDDGRNIVRLSQNYHMAIHATRIIYYNYINTCIYNAYVNHPILMADKTAVEMELMKQAQVLFSMDPSPYFNFETAYTPGIPYR